MDLAIATLSLGVVLLLISMPGYEFLTGWIKLNNPNYEAPILERLMLVSISGVLLSLGVAGLANQAGGASSNSSAQIAFAPAAVTFLYSYPICKRISLDPSKGLMGREWLTRVGLPFVLIALPIMIPALLWTTSSSN